VRTGAGVVVSPGLPLDPNAITAVDSGVGGPPIVPSRQ
jgi:hypothetical protein